MTIFSKNRKLGATRKKFDNEQQVVKWLLENGYKMPMDRHPKSNRDHYIVFKVQDKDMREFTWSVAYFK